MKKMTLEEHLKLGEFIRETHSRLQKEYITLAHLFGQSSPVTKKMGTALNKLDNARCELDDEYHRVATDEDFSKYGHVYYSKR